MDTRVIAVVLTVECKLSFSSVHLILSMCPESCSASPGVFPPYLTGNLLKSLQIYAVYGRSRVILGIMAIAYLSTAATTLYLFAKYVNSGKSWSDDVYLNMYLFYDRPRRLTARPRTIFRLVAPYARA